MAYIDETLLPRLVILQELVVPGSKSYPHPDAARDAMPYWTNAVGVPQIVRIDPDALNLIWVVRMRLHAGAAQEGYEGSLDKAVQGYMEDVIVFFETRRGLQIQDSDPWLDWIGPDGCSLQSPSIGFFGPPENQHKGVEFPLEAPVIRRLR